MALTTSLTRQTTPGGHEFEASHCPVHINTRVWVMYMVLAGQVRTVLFEQLSA